MPLDFSADLAAIAAAYDAAPVFDARAVDSWRALAADSVNRAAGIRERLAVIETDDPEPYPDAPTMCADIASGRFIVSRANSEHPLWSLAENVAFRIVHDVSGHFPTGGGFGWRGENLACGAHFDMIPAAAYDALFTECIGQTAYANVAHRFGPQKVARLGFVNMHARAAALWQAGMRVAARDFARCFCPA